MSEVNDMDDANDLDNVDNTDTQNSLSKIQIGTDSSPPI
jgi:hypothetical protein